MLDRLPSGFRFERESNLEERRGGNGGGGAVFVALVVVGMEI